MKLGKAARWESLAEEFFPKEKRVVRHITLAGGRDDEYHQLVLEK